MHPGTWMEKHCVINFQLPESPGWDDWRKTLPKGAASVYVSGEGVPDSNYQPRGWWRQRLYAETWLGSLPTLRGPVCRPLFPRPARARLQSKAQHIAARFPQLRSSRNRFPTGSFLQNRRWDLVPPRCVPELCTDRAALLRVIAISL